MKRKLLAVVLSLFLLLSFVITAIGVSGLNGAATLKNGDLDGNSEVNNIDAVWILKYDAAITELSKAQLIAADVNADGEVDNLDAAMVLQYDAGLIDGFPADETVSEEPSFSEETSEIQYPEGAYVVKRFNALSEVDWDAVPKADIDTYKWVNSVEYDAYGQLVYIQDYGFICRMTCMESDPPAQYTQFGDPVYLDSCMEFFAAWDNNSYINIESNSLGALCSQFGKSQSKRKPITDYLGNDIFEVTPDVGDDSWTLTMDIPLSKLEKFYGAATDAGVFVSGYTFTGNFYKIGADPETGVRHYGMWTEVGGNTPNFHQPAYFGTFVIA